MYSVHRRRFSYPSDVVRPWLDRVWSEDEAPVFPVDVVRPFRQNPPDEDAGALIPFRTLLGHGPLPFLYVGGDKTSFRVVTPFDGSHAFEIVPDGDGCVLVHTLSIPAPRAVEAIWKLLVKAGHDWALEAIFDRIEWALVHGAPPTKTKRPLPKGARVSHLLLVRLMPQRAEAAMRAWLIGKLPLS